MNHIAVYIPNYNGGQFLKRLELLDGLDYIVMDNCSSDDSVEICRKRGIEVICQNKTTDRTQNWLNCLRHFKAGRHEWLKWLFVGDELSPDAAGIMNSAASKYQKPALIIFDYSVSTENQNSRWKSPCGYGRISQQDIVRGILTEGNIFGSPVGMMLSKKAAEDELHTNGFQWIADAYLAYQMSKKVSCVFIEDEIGTFHAENRNYYSLNSSSIETYIEELEFIRLVGSENKTAYRDNKDRINSQYEDLIFRMLIGHTGYKNIGKIAWKLKKHGIRF